MKKGTIITEKEDIKKILQEAKTVAVLGLSDREGRPSNMVAAFLLEKKYNVIPVRPKIDKILGQKAYSSLSDIKESVDIVNVFRRSEQIKEHVQESINLKPKVFWMQEGISDIESAKILNDAGIDVVMNRCIKIDHQNIFGGLLCL